MKYFSIPEPCSENWNEMTATEKGAFCQKCSSEVYDVSRMSTDQIVDLIASEKKIPCMRMRPSQEESLNLHIGIQFRSQKRNMQRAMLFSLLVVFGFTLFSCENPQQIHERNMLSAAAETVVNSLEKATEVKGSIVDSTQKTENVAPLKKDPKEIPQCVVKEEELLLLGEPVLYEERVSDENKLQETSVREVTYVTGMPSMVHVTSQVIPEIKETQTTLNRDPNIPERFTASTFPNPAATSTQLEITLPDNTEHLDIRLLDMNGRVLRVINEKPVDAGKHKFPIDLLGLKPAYYLIDIRCNEEHKVLRLSKGQ